MYSSKAQLKPAGRNRTRAFFVGRLVQQRPPSSFVRHHVVVVVVTRRGSTRKTDTTTRRGEKGGGARGGRLIHADCARARGARFAQYNGGGGGGNGNGSAGKRGTTRNGHFPLLSHLVRRLPQFVRLFAQRGHGGFRGFVRQFPWPSLYVGTHSHTAHAHVFYALNSRRDSR